MRFEITHNQNQKSDLHNIIVKIIMAYRLTNAHVLPLRIFMWTQTPDCKKPHVNSMQMVVAKACGIYGSHTYRYRPVIIVIGL